LVDMADLLSHQMLHSVCLFDGVGLIHYLAVVVVRYLAVCFFYLGYLVTLAFFYIRYLPVSFFRSPLPLLRALLVTAEVLNDKDDSYDHQHADHYRDCDNPRLHTAVARRRHWRGRRQDGRREGGNGWVGNSELDDYRTGDY